jgi:hypothetical protein
LTWDEATMLGSPHVKSWKLSVCLMSSCEAGTRHYEGIDLVYTVANRC